MIFRKPLLFITCIYIFSLVACSKGDAGSAGAAGASGAVGPTGKQGPKGDTGASTVIFSNWIPITAADWKLDSMKVDSARVWDPVPNRSPMEVTEIDTLIYYHVPIATPKITKTMLDKGLVQFYIKDSTDYMKGVVNLFTEYGYVPVGVTNHRFLPVYNGGRFGLGINSFEIHLQTFGLTPDSTVLMTNWYGSSEVYNPYAFVAPRPPLSDIITYNELPPRTQFYIRYIIIPGGIPDGRQAAVDVGNYAAVKTYYHLPD